MKKILIVLLTMVLLLAGCGKNGASSPQSPSDESVADRQKPSSSETEISSEDQKIHSGTDYLIYMLGFLPGFAYLGVETAI